MKINKGLCLDIALNLPFGERRTQKEVLNAIIDETNEEHDYFKDKYEEFMLEFKREGEFTNDNN